MSILCIVRTFYLQTNDDSEIENDLNECQVFKFGLKILKKKRLDESQKQNTLVETLDTNFEPRRPHTIADMLNTSKCNDKSRSIHVRALNNHSYQSLRSFSLRVLIICKNILECHAEAFVSCKGRTRASPFGCFSQTKRSTTAIEGEEFCFCSY